MCLSELALATFAECCAASEQVVKDLNKRGYQSKMQFLLTKADTVESLQDLNKLIVQLTQRFTEQLSDTHAISVPAIWIPAADRQGIMKDEDNALGNVLDMIGKAIQKRVQLSMERLKEDAELIQSNIATTLANNKTHTALHASVNANLTTITVIFAVLALLLTVDTTMALFSAGWLPSLLTDVAPVMDGLTAAVPAHAALHAGMSLAGVEGWQARGLVFGGFMVLLSLLSRFFQWRKSGVEVLTEPQVSDLFKYRKAAATMLQRHDEVSQAYVDAAKAPEFTKAVLKRRGGKSGAAST